MDMNDDNKKSVSERVEAEIESSKGLLSQGDKKKLDIGLGIGTAVFVGALAIGGGIHFFNGDNLNPEISNAPKEPGNLEESAAPTPSLPMENAIVEEQETLSDFIEPIKTIEEGTDYVTLRVPTEYALYLIDKEKGAGMLGVSQEAGYNVYTGPNGKDLDGYVGVRDTLKYVIGAAETMNAAIRLGKLEAVGGITPEVVPGGVKLPAGYVLYHPPGEDGKGIDFLGGPVFSDTLDGVVPVEEGTSLEGYVGIPGSYAQLLMSADKTRSEMEAYYNGYNAKAIG